MSVGQREVSVVFGELGLNTRDVVRKPLAVREGNEPVLAAVV